MNYSLSLLGKTMFGLQNQGMLKSTKDRLDRQAQRDGKIEFYEKQKQNLKNTEAQTVEEIAKKLEMFHSYEDEIKAAKQEYNSSQMLHVLDEAQERAEKIAKAAEKNKPKTPEERRKDALDEAAGKDEDKGELSEMILVKRLTSLQKRWQNLLKRQRSLLMKCLTQFRQAGISIPLSRV